MFTHSQIKTTKRPNSFTAAQDADVYSYAELDQFWNRNLFSKHSNSTLQLLVKALSYSFVSSNTPNYDKNSPHDNLTIHYVLVYMTNSSILLLFLHLYGFQMLSLHCLDIHVVF